MTREEQRIIAERDDFEMMRHPDLWPNIVLPLKHREKCKRPFPGGHGILLCTGHPGQYAWYENVNMFHAQDLPTPQLGGEELLRKLLAEGWVVD